MLAEALVPGGSQARALQAIPFALEEQLADDVEKLHFALGSKDRDDNYPVAIIDRSTMDTISEQCQEAGLRPTSIVPETLALPMLEAIDFDEVSWTALLDEDQAVIRLNGYKGFATDTSVASFMLEGAKGDLAEDASPLLPSTRPTRKPIWLCLVASIPICATAKADWLCMQKVWPVNRTSTFCKVVTIRKHSSTRHGNHGVGQLHLPLFW